MAQLNLMVLDGFQLKSWNVHEDVAVLQPLHGQIFDALQIEAQLRQAGGRRHVQRLQGRLVYPSGDAQAVALLKAANGRVDVLVVGAEQEWGATVLPPG